MSPGRAEQALRARLSRGPLPFADFMEEALYGEAGYYRRAELPIGEAGDFVTGSSLSPLFGRTTGRLLRRLDAALGRPADLLEAGPGGGAHLAAVLDFLGAEPAGRRVLAWDRIPRPLPAGALAVADLEEVPERSVEGLVFSYELFDALPVHRLIGRDEGGGLGELWVEVGEEGGFGWREGDLSDPGLAGLLRAPGAPAVELAPGQVADLAPGWAPLYRQLARRLGRGLLVTCDYGFERERLLDPRVRRHGTLACYTRQRVHRNPFVQVGEQDLTAHVDFTALRQAGEEEGLATLAFTRQAPWLAACGLFEDLQGAGPEARQQAMALLDGEGMGEEIRVLVQARRVGAEDLFEEEELAALGLGGSRGAARPRMEESGGRSEASADRADRDGELETLPGAVRREDRQAELQPERQAGSITQREPERARLAPEEPSRDRLAFVEGMHPQAQVLQRGLRLGGRNPEVDQLGHYLGEVDGADDGMGEGCGNRLAPGLLVEQRQQGGGVQHDLTQAAIPGAAPRSAPPRGCARPAHARERGPAHGGSPLAG